MPDLRQYQATHTERTLTKPTQTQLEPMPVTARRRFLQKSAAYFGAVSTLGAPALAQSARPSMPYGLQLGDTTLEPNRQARCIVWARSDKAARMLVQWDTTDRFANPRTLPSPHALEVSDFTTRVDLSQLPPGQTIFTRVAMQDLGNDRAVSEWQVAQFRTPGLGPERGPRFVWGGDTAGQGFGINPDFGGMRIYELMRTREPDFFVHCGDTIYADGPIAAERPVEGGKTWKNLVAEGVEKVAETQDEFWGRYRYNLRDANVQKFSLQVPQLWQWDDHEVTNNWSDSKDLSADTRYTEKRVHLLTARATRAFLDYAPMRLHGPDESQRIYRRMAYGPLLDVFMIDMRSYRGPNTTNDQSTESPETVFLGAAQVDWLIRELKQSRATWKIISADMPLGLIVGDGKDAQGRDRFEASSNTDGPARGRELEIARLLRAIKRERIRNVAWITADVHYCAAHYYDPSKAQFTDFNPFWEFVAGPLHAGSFGPNALDNTFGPQVVFQKGPPAPNTSPLAGLQFFGQARIDPRSRALNVAFVDINGTTVFERTVPAQLG
jgi:alkaline phosphatase D